MGKKTVRLRPFPFSRPGLSTKTKWQLLLSTAVALAMLLLVSLTADPSSRRRMPPLTVEISGIPAGCDDAGEMLTPAEAIASMKEFFHEMAATPGPGGMGVWGSSKYPSKTRRARKKKRSKHERRRVDKKKKKARRKATTDSLKAFQRSLVKKIQKRFPSDGTAI